MGDWNHPATSPTETTAVTAKGTVSGHMTVGRRIGQGGSNWLLLLHYGAKDGTGSVKTGYHYYTKEPRIGQGGKK